jgi:hypothetical protein
MREPNGRWLKGHSANPAGRPLHARQCAATPASPSYGRETHAVSGADHCRELGGQLSRRATSPRSQTVYSKQRSERRMKKTRQKSNRDHVNPRTSEPRDRRGRFVTGNIGGPGRPPGSRNRLADSFVSDLCADWETHGREVLAQVRTSSPGTYLRVVAGIVPKDVVVQRPPNEYDHMTDRELVELVQRDAELLLQNLDRSEEED